MITHYNVFVHPSTGFHCSEAGEIEISRASDYDLFVAIEKGNKEAAQEWIARYPQGKEDGKSWAKGLFHKAHLVLYGYRIEKCDGVGVLLDNVHYYFQKDGGKVNPWFITFQYIPGYWRTVNPCNASFKEDVENIPQWVIELAQANI